MPPRPQPRPSARSAVPPFRVMEILADVERLRAAGRDVVSLCAGEPSGGAPEAVARAAARVHARNEGLGYTPALGIEPLRRAVAGPLAAAAVLFDIEALGVREVRALSALNDSKQHDPEAREELYPVVMRTAVKVVVVSRCVRGIDGYGLHKTNLAALRDALSPQVYDAGRFAEAIALFSDMTLSDDFAEFLTLPAYAALEG